MCDENSNTIAAINKAYYCSDKDQLEQI